MTLHLVEAAERAEEGGNFEEASRIWYQLASERRSAVFFCRWGNAAQKLTKWNEAEKAFSNALAADPGFSSAMEALGMLFFYRTDGNHRQNVERARDWYLSALLTKRCARTLSLLGHAYIQLDQLSAAKEALLEAIHLDDSYSEAYFNLAVVEKAEDPDKAKVLLERCIARDPNFMEAYFHLGLLMREEDEEEARNLFEKAIELDFKEIPPHQELGTLLQKEGNLPGAEKEFRWCLKIAPEDCSSRLYLANNLAVQGRNAEAEQEYRIAMNVCRDVEAAITFFANFLDSLSRSEEANMLRSRLFGESNQ